MREIVNIVMYVLCLVIAVVLIVLLIKRVRAIIAWYKAKVKAMGGLKVAKKEKAQGIIFGKKIYKNWLINLIFGKRVVYSPTNAEGSAAIFGSSGSHKTAGVIIPSLRAWTGTTLALDISGDIEPNVNIPDKLVIAPDASNSAAYDVLAAVDNEQDDNEKIMRLQQLSFALIPDRQTTDDTSAFYLEESRKLLQAAMIMLYFEGLDFVDMCKRIIVKTSENLISEIQFSNNEYARMLGAGFVGGNEKTLAATKQELDKILAQFVLNRKLAAVLRRGGCSAATLEEKTIFLNIPAEKLEVYAPLWLIIVTQTLNYLAARQITREEIENGTRSPILIALDEFAQFERIHGILSALQTLRKRFCRIMLLTQSITDLERIYGQFESRSILENLAYTAVLKTNSVYSQEYFSALAGEHDVTRETHSETCSANGDLTQTLSESTTRERLIKPEEFRELDENLILFHPAGVMKLRKNPYFNK